MILFTPTVGVAPGTTTMTLGDCPPDPIGMYTSPPNVATGPGSGLPLALHRQEQVLNPYGTDSRLTGLAGLNGGTLRWSLIAFAGLVTFASVLSYAVIRRKFR